MPLKEVQQAERQAKHPPVERVSPFEGKTKPWALWSEKDVGSRMRAWLDAVQHELEPPTKEQLQVLKTVGARVLTEIRALNCLASPKTRPHGDKDEEPILGFVHGSPGTGKSRVIQWVCRMFREAFEWTHEEEFLCVAFQNKVAHAMGGRTMHSGADIDITGHRKLTHTDIDLLHIRNQSLRWILIDELPMISDELLGSFEYSITDAADKNSHFKIRSDGSIRIFGGYNVLMFGDFYQIPPIPASGTLAIPLAEKKPPSEAAKTALNILWGEGVNALNYFAELTIQKRIDDKWYSK